MTVHTTMSISGPVHYEDAGVVKVWAYFSCEGSVQGGDSLDAYVNYASLIPEGYDPDEIWIDKCTPVCYGTQIMGAGHLLVGVWGIEQGSPYIDVGEVFDGKLERPSSYFPGECMWMNDTQRLRFNGSCVAQAAGYNPVLDLATPSYVRYWSCGLWWHFDLE